MNSICIPEMRMHKQADRGQCTWVLIPTAIVIQQHNIAIQQRKEKKREEEVKDYVWI